MLLDFATPSRPTDTLPLLQYAACVASYSSTPLNIFGPIDVVELPYLKHHYT
jgi:hypothetical protein